ncbi:hypothetical protein HDU96_001641 [Phlyctochytrium bullatum]|nr:hypothetical protein HDU96_001641 [Phlyctochytrium bullatum]
MFADWLWPFPPAPTFQADRDVPDLSDRTILITGPTAGLGKATAEAMAAKGAHLVFACRNEAKGHELADQLMTKHKGCHIDVLHVDMSSLASVHSFAESFIERGWPLHVLLNNAGEIPGVLGARNCQLTEDGIELHMAINYFSLALLTLELLPVLVRTAETLHRNGKGGDVRIVNVSSFFHSWVHNPVDFTGIADTKRKRFHFPRLLPTLSAATLATYAAKRAVRILLLPLPASSLLAKWIYPYLVSHAGYDALTAYSNSKLLVLQFTRYLHCLLSAPERLSAHPTAPIHLLAVDPGFVATTLFFHHVSLLSLGLGVSSTVVGASPRRTGCLTHVFACAGDLESAAESDIRQGNPGSGEDDDDDPPGRHDARSQQVKAVGRHLYLVPHARKSWPTGLAWDLEEGRRVWKETLSLLKEKGFGAVVERAVKECGIDRPEVKGKARRKRPYESEE